MMMKMDAHSIFTLSLSDCLLSGSATSGNEIVMSIKLQIYVWAVTPSGKRIVMSSSQHGDESGCSLSMYCKFEMNLRLYVIWLVAMKLSHQ